MAGWWSFHKTRTEKATKFGIVGPTAVRSSYAAPRPTRHLPTQCRPGWLCNERGKTRTRLGRKHLLARPVTGSRRQPQSVVAQLLPSVPVGIGESPAAAFARATERITPRADELVVGISSVRRVQIEGTGVIALEKTRCTRTPDGARNVTLFWAVLAGSGRILRMARICARGEAELRTYRTQVADFLRRWTTVAVVTVEDKTVLLRRNV